MLPVETSLQVKIFTLVLSKSYDVITALPELAPLLHSSAGPPPTPTGRPQV